MDIRIQMSVEIDTSEERSSRDQGRHEFGFFCFCTVCSGLGVPVFSLSTASCWEFLPKAVSSRGRQTLKQYDRGRGPLSRVNSNATGGPETADTFLYRKTYNAGSLPSV